MKLWNLIALNGLVAAAIGCGGQDPIVPIDPPVVPPTEHPAVAEARRNLPTLLDLHTTVIARSCGPNSGVCHNGKEFPDLRTPGSLINSLSKPCNPDRFDEPEKIFDGCEPAADELVILGPQEWRTKIAYLGPEELDDTRQATSRHLRLLEAPPRDYDRVAAKIMRGSEIWVTLPAQVQILNGKTDGKVMDTFGLDYATVRALNQVHGGDPNQNGIFGADQPWELIAPGHADRSYLIGRITGLVPGTRMPLANRALIDSEYVALICWIETMSDDPGPHDRIDYDGCNFAKHVVSYQVGLAR